MNKIIGIICSMLFALVGHTQTGLIAHKSHSGSAKSYAFAEFGNFGNPPPIVRMVQKINDTTIVMMQDDMGAISIDTVYNHPLFSNPNMTIDSLKKTYYYGSEVEFINFEKKVVDDESQNALPYVVEPTQEAVPVEVKSKKQLRKEKRTKKNWILFWVIGVGTFGGIVLMGNVNFIRKRKLQPVYA